MSRRFSRRSNGLTRNDEFLDKYLLQLECHSRARVKKKRAVRRVRKKQDRRFGLSVWASRRARGLSASVQGVELPAARARDTSGVASRHSLIWYVLKRFPPHTRG